MKNRAISDAQKKEIVNRLLAVWLEHKEWRLGQLITNYTGGNDIFYIEDYDLIEHFEKISP